MVDKDSAPLAVVTGGSTGIGYELAKQMAGHGYDVLLAAEDPVRLTEAARHLQEYGQQVMTHSADLSSEEGVDSLFGTITALGRPVDILCVNAGVGLGGAFADTELQRELKMIDLNVRGAVQLTKLVVRQMVAEDNGKILFTSSIAATMPDPFEAVYGATKVFLRWFGEALRDELKETNVGVTVLMPGVTDTNFFQRAEMMNTKAGTMKNKDDPAVVAEAAFNALWQDDDKVIPKMKNKIMGAVASLLPDPAAAAAHRNMSKPGSGK
ncbi:SDR family NAD(P)-dependent oxidoreductase [Oryzifoliimicrobium ureilyticus]|uniref:SDR family NAD(P)-dependent oxidoreductase n=1 Tax=Oryzifoliimicrobium ureilyticus TaxID=3113724 RepID=UPI00307673DC